MTPRLELLTALAARLLAHPLSRMHRAVFADDPWDPRAICEIAGLAGFFGLIAWEDTEPAGFALAFGTGDEYEIAALGVMPGHRRTGVGRALLDAVCREAARRGARAIILEVAANNTAAFSLYAARGFARAGRRRDYYRLAGRSVEAEVLRLTLAAPPTPI